MVFDALHETVVIGRYDGRDGLSRCYARRQISVRIAAGVFVKIQGIRQNCARETEKNQIAGTRLSGFDATCEFGEYVVCQL